ncbi:MAG TPA: hypothetical protein VLE96_02525 [Chlamydiales bacterium]|nr:hypothetical protein [Chlamydiales bacterium]
MLFKIILFLFTAISSFAYQNSHVFADGSRYEGEWEGNERHGFGIQFWPNGAYYSGTWFNDLRHGEGLFVWADGTYYQGIWVNNWPGTHLENPDIFAIHNYDEIQKNFPNVQITKKGLILESNNDYNDAFAAKYSEYDLLSKGLSLRGIDAKPIHFSSKHDLQQKIQDSEKLDLVWLRAHGSNQGATFNCGSDTGTAEFLALLLKDRLSEQAVIVFDSCETGAPFGLAEQLQNLFSQSGVHATIIAPVAGIAYSGFDVATYEIVVFMINPFTGNNVAKTFIC